MSACEAVAELQASCHLGRNPRLSSASHDSPLLTPGGPVLATGVAPDSSVRLRCRKEQERLQQQAETMQQALAKAESTASDLRRSGAREREAVQERLRAAEAAAAAAQLELERERFKRRSSEGEAVAAAREEAGAAARALHASQAEAERLQGGRARLQAEKDELEEALRAARSDVLAAHSQVAKATEELTQEVSKVRRKSGWTCQRCMTSWCPKPLIPILPIAGPPVWWMPTSRAPHKRLASLVCARVLPLPDWHLPVLLVRYLSGTCQVLAEQLHSLACVTGTN